jgi:hypothetical protein
VIEEVSYILLSNYNNLPDTIRKHIHNLAQHKQNIEKMAAAIIINYNNLPDSTRKLLITIDDNKYSLNIVRSLHIKKEHKLNSADFLRSFESNFLEIPEKLRNGILSVLTNMPYEETAKIIRRIIDKYLNATRAEDYALEALLKAAFRMDLDTIGSIYLESKTIHNLPPRFVNEFHGILARLCCENNKAIFTGSVGKGRPLCINCL